ncbi:MAG: hypothetical protein V1746_04565 [bacterium]
MSLYKNAIDSIKVGVLDLQKGNKIRVISAMRNIYAGILLLIKEKLRQLSPPGSGDVLIQKKILPVMDASGRVVFRGSGKKTVDFNEIKERCENLGIKLDWKKLEDIREIRNDIEHKFSKLPPKAIQKILSESHVLIHDILVKHLHDDPQRIFGEKVWRYLLAEAKIYQTERSKCLKALSSIDWRSAALATAIEEYPCSKCGLDLLIPQNNKVGRENVILKCKVCGQKHKYEELAEDALKKSLSWRDHLSIKDGGEENLVNCPFCLKESYIMEEKKCALCGESANHECIRCGDTIPASEISDGDMCLACSIAMRT